MNKLIIAIAALASISVLAADTAVTETHKKSEKHASGKMVKKSKSMTHTADGSEVEKKAEETVKPADAPATTPAAH